MTHPNFYPPYEEIAKMTETPTPGEQAMLDFLYNNLDENFDVIFHPELNGLKPDIAIIRKYGGIIIIEVKDWDLNSYRAINKNNWLASNSSIAIKSPFSQVKFYKNQLLSLYLPSLTVERFLNAKNFSLVRTFIYFHKATHKQVEAFCKENNNTFICTDDLNPKKFKQEIVNKNRNLFNGNNDLFSDTIYNEALAALNPPEYDTYKYPVQEYTKDQKKIIKLAKTKKRLAIEGAAGSGKTQTLAKIITDKIEQSPNCNILILCYNKTLPTFFHLLIRKAISKIIFLRKQITMNHYHNFLKNAFNDLGFSYIHSLQDYDFDFSQKIKITLTNPNNSISEHIIKSYQYDFIVIDEIQDFKENWQKNILAFLKENGSVVYCGDIKQNIYASSKQTEKQNIAIFNNINTRIKYTELTRALRTPSIITDLANAFSAEFLKISKNILPRQIELFPEQIPRIEYHELDMFNYDFIKSKIIECKNKVSYHNEHEIIVLGENILRLRHLHKLLTEKYYLDSTITFESQAEFIALCKKCLKYYNGRDFLLKRAHNLFLSYCAERKISFNINFENLSEAEEILCEKCLYDVLYSVRSSRKYNFKMYSPKNKPLYKLSTIHSFKGWELKNVILILEHRLEEVSKNESEDNLVYTALTRAKVNLIIINIGNEKYKTFFKEYLRKQSNSRPTENNPNTTFSISVSEHSLF